MLATRPVLMDDAGEDAFPGAAFSLNQNRRAGPRSFPGELKGFRHRGTVADKIVLKGAHQFLNSPPRRGGGGAKRRGGAKREPGRAKPQLKFGRNVSPN